MADTKNSDQCRAEKSSALSLISSFVSRNMNENRKIGALLKSGFFIYFLSRPVFFLGFLLCSVTTIKLMSF